MVFLPLILSFASIFPIGQVEKAIKAERGNNAETSIFGFDIHPYPYQSEILEKLEAEREVNRHYRNLVVAATGTGKTVISAFDYKHFFSKNKGKPCRLLFIAHREEILKQSMLCFRAILKDANFGELYVGSYIPESIDHLFISIQTFNSKEFYKYTTREFYDYIVVDEFHHAAAPTYQILLDYYQPKILLGLTATPERMDGKSIIEYFDNRIAAEIRLPEAIDRKLLCPFHYFGVTDNVDLRLTGLSDEKARESAKRKLIDGDIRFIFVVDLYNEGVDIPDNPVS